MVPTPNYIKSCLIRNATTHAVQVRVTCVADIVGPRKGHHFRHNIDLAPGQEYQVEERTITDGSATFVSPIHKIDVQLPNEQQMSIKEPFDGVSGIRKNWLFVIENDHISSHEYGNFLY